MQTPYLEANHEPICLLLLIDVEEKPAVPHRLGESFCRRHGANFLQAPERLLGPQLGWIPNRQFFVRSRRHIQRAKVYPTKSRTLVTFELGPFLWHTQSGLVGPSTQEVSQQGFPTRRPLEENGLQGIRARFRESV